MAGTRFLVMLTNGQSVYVDPTGDTDWATEARRIADRDGAWDPETKTYYPARSILSVQVIDGEQDRPIFR